jgi:hypothetical protein
MENQKVEIYLSDESISKIAKVLYLVINEHNPNSFIIKELTTKKLEELQEILDKVFKQ